MAEAPAPVYLGPAAHTSAGDNKPVKRIVIHCTVSPCEAGGARNIAAYFRSKTAGGSAHYVVDPGETVQVVYDGVIAWHAPPNPNSLGVELCDPMKGKKARWADADHTAMLDRAAELVAGLCLAYDVPVRKVGAVGLKLGRKGICGHVDVAKAFGQSTHWDPGPGFPWRAFVKQVKAAAERQSAPKHRMATPEDTPMTLIVHPNGSAYHLTAKGLLWLPAAVRDAITGPVTVVPCDDVTWDRYVKAVGKIK